MGEFKQTRPRSGYRSPSLRLAPNARSGRQFVAVGVRRRRQLTAASVGAVVAERSDEWPESQKQRSKGTADGDDLLWSQGHAQASAGLTSENRG